MAKVIACGPGAIKNLTDFFDVIWTPVIDRCSQLRLRGKFDLIRGLSKPKPAFFLSGL